MRSLVALLLIASVLHTQLAVGCHCQHALDAKSHSTDVEDHCYWHGDAVGGHVHYLRHHGDGEAAGDSVSGDAGQPLPPHAPCDHCPECASADPVGLRIEALPDLSVASLLTVWSTQRVERLSTTARHAQHRQSTAPDGVRSLLACGTLLRI